MAVSASASARDSARRPARVARAAPATVDVVFVLPRGSLILDWAGPAETFRIAGLEADEPPGAPRFRLRFAAPSPTSPTSVGALLAGLEPLPPALAAPAWVLLVGRTDTGDTRDDQREDQREARAVVAWLRRLRPGRDGLRLVTVCSGALLAAEAGLLAGHRVTTHHRDLDHLQALAADATVVRDRVFVHDRDVWSSAGITAGIDLALHLVTEHCGPVVAARVAQRMAVALRRGPDDPQPSPFLAHRQHLNARLHRVQDEVSRAPRQPWNAARMAAVAHATPRTLSRLFAAHAGTTPVAYLRGIRLAAAQAALQAGSSVARAAEAAGFGSDLQLRRAWRAAGAPGAPSAHARGRGGQVARDPDAR
jgi:transcriptional regulator GlxA family with amidase domain